MSLHADRAGHGAPLVLVHGFTQTRRCWGPVVEPLLVSHELVLVDAPGHGRSSHVRVDLEQGAELLGATGGAATYLGYSMGARLCLQLALQAPELVDGLVMIGGTAGIEDRTDRHARQAQDERKAARLRTEGLEHFLDEWLRQPLFADLPPERAFRAERLENDADALASSLELAGTGAQSPSWERLADLQMPVLAVAGARDAKFAALSARMVEAIGTNATLALVADAGHAAHLEQPESCGRTVERWLAEHGL